MYKHVHHSISYTKIEAIKKLLAYKAFCVGVLIKSSSSFFVIKFNFILMFAIIISFIVHKKTCVFRERLSL